MNLRMRVFFSLIVAFLLFDLIFASEKFLGSETIPVTTTDFHRATESPLEITVEADKKNRIEDLFKLDPPIPKISTDWLRLLDLFNLVQPRRFSPREHYAYFSISSLLEELGKRCVKVSLTSKYTKESLKTELKKSLIPYQNGIPESFWEEIFKPEKTGDPQLPSFDLLVQRVKPWKEYWKNLFSRSSLIPENEAKAFDNSPPTWDLEEMELLKLKTIDENLIMVTFSAVTTKYKDDEHINALTMIKILNDCFEITKLPLSFELWENIVVIPIPEDTYLLFKTYAEVVEKNDKLFKACIKKGSNGTVPIIEKWNHNIEQYKLNADNYLNPYILEVILKQLEFIQTILQRESEKKLSLEQTLTLICTLRDYGNEQMIKIPTEFFTQLLFNERCIASMSTRDYFRKALSRLAIYKNVWIRKLRCSVTDVIICKHQPKKVFDLQKDFKVDMQQLGLGSKTSGTHGCVFFLPLQSEETTIYAIKLFKTAAFVRELYINDIIRTHLGKKENQTMRNGFLLPIGYIKKQESTNISGLYMYGLVYPCVPLTLDQLIKETPTIPVELIQVIMYQLLTKVGFLHKIGILHMDLKPSNILIHKSYTEEPNPMITDTRQRLEFYKKNITVYIIDYGCSAYKDSTYSHFQWPKNEPGHNAPGTKMYDSPLKLMSVDCIDERDESWTIGMIFFQLCTKKAFLEEAHTEKIGNQNYVHCLLPTALSLQKEKKKSRSELVQFPLENEFSTWKVIDEYRSYRTKYRKFWNPSTTTTPKLITKLYLDLEKLDQFTEFWKETPLKDQAFDLLRHLLELDHERRITPKKCLELDFFKELH